MVTHAQLVGLVPRSGGLVTLIARLTRLLIPFWAGWVGGNASKNLKLLRMRNFKNRMKVQSCGYLYPRARGAEPLFKFGLAPAPGADPGDGQCHRKGRRWSVRGRAALPRLSVTVLRLRVIQLQVAGLDFRVDAGHHWGHHFTSGL